MRKAVLERRFSDVRRVADAVEALCLVEEHSFSGEFGVVVSSHQMPGIGGPAFVSELHNRIPTLPVLVLGDNGDNASDYPGERVYFLPKPVTPESLLDAATRILK